MSRIPDGFFSAILLVSSCLVASLLFPFYTVPLVQAAGFTGTGLVCITSSTTATNCDNNASSIGRFSVGSRFTVGVFVNNSRAMNSFNIYIRSDPAFVSPVSAALGSLIAHPGPTSICVNSTAVIGGCTPGGPGIVEVSSMDSSGTNECGGVSPCSGMAFTITYVVVASTRKTPLSYPTSTGCTSSSVSSPPNTCVLVTDNVGNILPENIQGASVVSVPNMIAVVTGTNGDLYWNGFYTDHWIGWQPLSGGSPAPPGLCESTQGRVELVVMGYDENVYHKSFINGTWSATWDKVPTGATDEQPACAVLGTTMFTAVRGTDTNLYANSLDLKTGTWSTWLSLGGASPSPPALAASPSINALDLVVRGTDNRVYHKFYANGTWSPWECTSYFGCDPYPRTIASPTVVSGNANGTDLVQVAILSPNTSGAGSPTYEASAVELAGRSWTTTFPRFQLGAWATPPCSSAQDPPALVADPAYGLPGSAGTVYIVTKGSNGDVFIDYRNFDTTTSWTNSCPSGSGGNVMNRPAAANAGPGKEGVVDNSSTSALWYNSWSCCGVWSGWTQVGGSSSIDPGLVSVP